MAYSDFGPPRRSRRRRNVVVLLVVLLIVGVLALAVRYQTERRESIDYLSVAEEVALQHAAMSDRIGVLLEELGQEERPEVVLQLDTLVVDARQAVSALDGLVVTRPVAEASGLMTVAVEAWSDGLVAVGDALVAILDAEEGDFSGEEELRNAFELLRLGDLAYARVMTSVALLDPEIVPMAFPIVSYTGGDYAGLYDAAVVAQRLRGRGGLAELIDVALTAETVPGPVSEAAGGIQTIPASDAFSLEVVVSNTGNVVVEKVTVTVTLEQVGVASNIPPLGQLIPAIEPDRSERLVFENLEAQPGNVYNITAIAVVDGGGDETDDNTFTLVFQRNAE